MVPVESVEPGLIVIDGRPVVRKHYPTVGRADPEYEFAWLTRAGGPARPISRTPTTMDVAFVSGPTLAALAPPGAPGATLMADLARRVADLHQRGLVHGNLGADHVICSPVGVGRWRPVLISPRPSTELRVDIDGLGQVAQQVAALWSLDANGRDQPDPFRSDRWDELALWARQDPTLSAARLATEFEALSRRRQGRRRAPGRSTGRWLR